jgi:hypothetical protein
MFFPEIPDVLALRIVSFGLVVSVRSSEEEVLREGHVKTGVGERG